MKPEPGGRTPEPAPSLPAAEKSERDRLIAGSHPEPHRLLGAHPASCDGQPGVVVRAFHPEAAGVECVLGGGDSVPLERVAEGGLFAGFLPDATLPLPYRLRFRFPGGETLERNDPYRFPPTLGEVDLHLFAEGKHRRLWERLGAHPRVLDGVPGVAFAVWAPNAVRVSVVGDFCDWDGRLFPMRSLGGAGVFELFIPEVSPGALYKFEIKTREERILLKSDPFAFATEKPPATASRVFASSHEWGDAEWMSARPRKDPTRAPMAVYEVHLGSWARVREEGDRPLTYRESAERLAAHVRRLGFTHLELLPVFEHPFAGSWGYQVTGYYAPSSRYGTPDDFRFFVDHCHRNGIGVILDWVPGHFPKDDFALGRFDGTALFEHEDPLLGEHPDWGTLIFRYGRREVRNFLIANALFWLEEFHADGLRVDAVASMLYLDYSREEGAWRPNRLGGRENLEAVELLKELNETIRSERPGCFTIAEESTAWPGVTRPVREGGLGFTFKWNLGWMHDTLAYFSKDPAHRPAHYDRLTFAMHYEHSERFLMPLSHDEVVHEKGSLLEKMPGDARRKLANLRLLFTYQFTRPGKKLLFMGAELATPREWNHDAGLDWHLAADPPRAGLRRFLEDLGRLYREHSPLWRRDYDPSGFSWLDCQDPERSVISYLRRDGDKQLIVVLNLTSVPREAYRVGVPRPGRYVQRLSTDERRYGGGGFQTLISVETEEVPRHGHAHSLRLRLPPLGALILAEEGPGPAI